MLIDYVIIEKVGYYTIIRRQSTGRYEVWHQVDSYGKNHVFEGMFISKTEAIQKATMLQNCDFNSMMND